VHTASRVHSVVITLAIKSGNCWPTQ